MIYGQDYLIKDMVKRNQLREQIALLNTSLSTEHDLSILRKRNKARDFFYYFLDSVVAVLVILLLIYKKLSNLWYLIFFLILVLGSISLLVIGFVFKSQYHKLQGNKTKESKKIEALNIERRVIEEKIINEALAIVCFNDHYFELMAIDDKQKMYKKWDILVNEYFDAINKKHHFDATSEDILEYYRVWENKKV